MVGCIFVSTLKCTLHIIERRARQGLIVPADAVGPLVPLAKAGDGRAPDRWIDRNLNKENIRITTQRYDMVQTRTKMCQSCILLGPYSMQVEHPEISSILIVRGM